MTKITQSNGVRRTRVAAAALALAAGLAMAGGAAMAGDENVQGAAGMKVYVDPTTGQLSHQPPANQPSMTLSPAEQNAFSRSGQGLVQVPNAGPGGGVKLDLQGRFQSPLIATVGPDGRVQMKHGGELPHDHGAK